MTDPNALLMGAGVPATKPQYKGHTVTIDRITNVEAVQRVDFKTRLPLFYEDKKPQMQIVVTGETSERNPDNPDDNGLRKMYIKGQARQAVRDAVIAASAQGLENGGALALQWYDDKPPEQVGMSPQKLHKAQYRPPAVSALLGDQGQPSGQQAPQGGDQPAPTGDLFAPLVGTDVI